MVNVFGCASQVVSAETESCAFVKTAADHTETDECGCVNKTIYKNRWPWPVWVSG